MVSNATEQESKGGQVPWGDSILQIMCRQPLNMFEPQGFHVIAQADDGKQTDNEPI